MLNIAILHTKKVDFYDNQYCFEGLRAAVLTSLKWQSLFCRLTGGVAVSG